MIENGNTRSALRYIGEQMMLDLQKENFLMSKFPMSRSYVWDWSVHYTRLTSDRKIDKINIPLSMGTVTLSVDAKRLAFAETKEQALASILGAYKKLIREVSQDLYEQFAASSDLPDNKVRGVMNLKEALSPREYGKPLFYIKKTQEAVAEILSTISDLSQNTELMIVGSAKFFGKLARLVPSDTIGGKKYGDKWIYYVSNTPFIETEDPNNQEVYLLDLRYFKWCVHDFKFTPIADDKGDHLYSTKGAKNENECSVDYGFMAKLICEDLSTQKIYHLSDFS